MAFMDMPQAQQASLRRKSRELVEQFDDVAFGRRFRAALFQTRQTVGHDARRLDGAPSSTAVKLAVPS